jgi:predicted Ser/Thr protein kinase/tetratricopeptide (TPR) repeat protein
MTSTCPRIEVLQRMVAGDLDGTSDADVESHVASCLECQRRIETILDGSLAAPRAAGVTMPPYLERIRQVPPERAADDPSTEAIGETPGARGMGPSQPPLLELPGYEIVRELGRGGMGVVYEAVRTKLKRPVALKMILAGAYADAGARARFESEAELVARLKHPNIVVLYHVAEHEGRPFLEMEYLEGGSLAARIRTSPLHAREAAVLVEPLARAMDVAHRAGVIHRDIKPANILLDTAGRPKIVDFGLAKLLGGDSGVTHSGAVMGSPSYMAPEQAEGKIGELGPAVDIYALGVVLYESLTGRPPFRGATPVETLEQVRHTEPIAPSRLVPRIDRDIETIVLKCMEKAPARRYASAAALADDLRRYLDGQPILARRAGAVEHVAKWARRKPAVAALLMLAIVAAVALIGGGVYYNRLLQRSNNDLGGALARARKAEQDAVSQRDLALGTLKTLVFEVQDKLGALPAARSLQQSLLNEAIRGLAKLAADTAANEPNINRAEAHARLASIYKQIGRFDDCRSQCEQVEAICKAIPSGDPHFDRARILEAAAMDTVASNLLDADKPDLAIELLRRCLATLDAVREDSPRLKELQVERMHVLSEISRACLWRWDKEGARRYTKEGAALAETLLVSTPDDPNVLFEVASIAAQQALLSEQERDINVALEHHRRTEEVCRRALELQPESRRIVGLLHNAIGNQSACLVDLGDIPAGTATAERVKRLQLAEEAKDPAGYKLQIDLIIVEGNIGELLMRQGRFHDALLELRDAINRYAKLEKGRIVDSVPGLKD